MRWIDSHHIEKKEEIPEDLGRGNYVVVDVMYFSTTVIELFSNGAKSVSVAETNEEVLEHKKQHPNSVIGGEKNEDYEPVGEYDFFNSPSYVQGLDILDRDACMSSTNGAKAVSEIARKSGEGSEIYIGSTTNAAYIGQVLADDDKPTYLVSAGTKGDKALEDNIGASIIARYIEGVPLSEFEVETYSDTLKVSKGFEYYDEASEVRRKDIERYVTNINSRPIVPKLSNKPGYSFENVGVEMVSLGVTGALS